MFYAKVQDGILKIACLFFVHTSFRVIKFPLSVFLFFSLNLIYSFIY